MTGVGELLVRGGEKIIRHDRLLVAPHQKRYGARTLPKTDRAGAAPSRSTAGRIFG